MSNDTATETAQARLTAWFEKERAAGLFDMKFFVSPSPDVSTSERAEDILKILEAHERGDGREIFCDDDFLPQAKAA